MSKSITLFVKNYLVLISYFLLLSISPCMAQEEDALQKEYEVLIKAKGNEITGYCLMSFTSSQEVIGTIVNEFGIKVFDFIYANGKAKIINVIAPLNKWYIRKILRKDMHFILTNIDNATCDYEIRKGKRVMKMTLSGDIVVENRRHNIIYTFTNNKTTE